jgi:hypothetical protein
MQALVHRTNFKILTDREISQRFTSLVNEVDDVSRAAWDKRKEPNWPFAEKLLRQTLNGTNYRELTQQIIQNSIWLILFERIFSTPFKVFGDEGEYLQQMWIGEFGTGITCFRDLEIETKRSQVLDDGSKAIEGWPKPTERAERWRYEKIESKTQEGYSADKNHRAKSYDDYLAETVRCIEEAMFRVATDVNKETITDFVGVAADLWLEVGRQRCRVLISMPRFTENLLGARRKDSATIELIVKPQILRFGTSAGLDLDKSPVVVTGCEAEQLKVQLRRLKA